MSSLVVILVDKVRRLVRTANKSSIILSHVRKTAKFYHIAGDLIIDHHIRWNSSKLMIDRFIRFKPVIFSITQSPGSIIGLKKTQIALLSKLSFSEDEFAKLNTLSECLDPFYQATLILSGQKYLTVSFSYMISSFLKGYLSRESDDPFKDFLLKKLRVMFKLHFITKRTDAQANVFLIASYLDPSNYRYVRTEDVLKAESLLVKEMELLDSCVLESRKSPEEDQELISKGMFFPKLYS